MSGPVCTTPGANELDCCVGSNDGDGHEGCPSHCQLVYVIKLTLKLENYGLIWVENPPSHKRLVSVVE